MDQVLRGLDFVYVYIDDVLIASATSDEHLSPLRMVFERFENHGITINPENAKLVSSPSNFSVTRSRVKALNLSRINLKRSPTIRCPNLSEAYADFSFCVDVRYIDGSNNAVADALSCAHMNQLSSTPIDLERTAAAQNDDPELVQLRSNPSLKVTQLPVLNSDIRVYCDLSTERFHRQLKAVIMASSSDSRWSERLPAILLGIRNTIKEDIGCCPAELVFGTTLRLPGEMVLDSRTTGELDLVR
ncbi:unnamed protein product [Dicrocoelium dendriticum]|nr:unnamed protein product [Dicrocoelium dendriticum]